MTYNQSQDIEFYKNIKSGTKLGEYITSNGNSIKLGDTLIIGAPTSSSTYNVGHAWGQSSGNKNIRTGSAILEDLQVIKHLPLFNWVGLQDLVLFWEL